MYYTYEDITIYYEKYGERKKSVVILPGWGDTRKTFNYMINFLKEYFTVYILDFPGFGNSPFPEKNLTIYNYTELVYEWIKYLELDNPILIGHSFGGRIITSLLGYYKYPFKNVIYLDSAGIIPKKKLTKKIRTSFYKFLKKLKMFLPKKYKDRWLKFLFTKFASTDYQNLSDNMKKTFQNVVNLDLTPYLKYINAKVLLIWGSNDLATPIRDAKIMNKSIIGSELIVLDKGTHFVYLDYPILVNKIIYEQLKDEII